jgi:hypothetical protein
MRTLSEGEGCGNAHRLLGRLALGGVLVVVEHPHLRPGSTVDAGRHGWADLLRLVGAVRRLAYDGSLAPDDAMRRIRDAFGVYDGRIDLDDE